MARTKFIHTVDFDLQAGLASTSAGLPILLDLPAELTRRTNKMQRQGAGYHIGGIDITVQNSAGGSGGGSAPGTYTQIAGRLRYFTPTKGRVEAYKAAYDTWRETLRAAGVTPNRFTDFRVTPMGLSNYANPQSGVDSQVYPTIPNLVTLDGARSLACFSNAGQGYEIFLNWNAQQAYNPITPTQLQSTGLYSRTDANSGGQTDFLLEEEVLMTGWNLDAETDYTEIPFVASFDNENNVYSWHWDPSPNAYLSVMCGWFEIVLDEVVTDADSALNAPLIEMNISFDILGCGRGYNSRSVQNKKTQTKKSSSKKKK